MDINRSIGGKPILSDIDTTYHLKYQPRDSNAGRSGERSGHCQRDQISASWATKLLLFQTVVFVVASTCQAILTQNKKKVSDKKSLNVFC